MNKRIHHYILTRFCLRLWTRDKNGTAIDWEKWIAGRLELFEQYCLPSVMAQTCKDFRWVLLCDEHTPEWVRERIRGYRERCPQIKVAYVPTARGYHFPEVLRRGVKKLLGKDGVGEGDLCLTTYLDNDDALHEKYVEVVQKEAARIDNEGIYHRFSLDGGAASGEPFFLSFDYGIQYFTELRMATRIYYPNNHFMTAVEYPVVETPEDGVTVVKNVNTCYGYGSHFLLEENKKAQVEHVVDKAHPMWVEVIHKCNVDNDVKMTLDTHIVDNMEGFGSDMPLDSSLRGAYLLRCVKQILRRLNNKMLQHHKCIYRNKHISES